MDADAVAARSLSARLVSAALSAAELITVYLGHRLGLYEALARLGPGTSRDIAARVAIAPRYAREWLEQQAAAGIVDVDDPKKSADDRLFALAPGHAEALTDPESPFNISAMALLPIGGIAQNLPRLLDAYRSGSGVDYGDFGDDFRDGQASLNRAVFVHQLHHWIAIVAPEIEARLQREHVSIVDMACGAGWSTIALARRYPKARVWGFDTDNPSIDRARKTAIDEGVAARVRFDVGDVATAGEGQHALVCIFDALHDMPDPVAALRRCHQLVAADGVVLVLEPRGAESFDAPASETERFLYAVSLLHCLPVGMSDPRSVQTGAVLRPSTLRQWAADAGFREVHDTPVEHPFLRLYRLRP